MKKRPPGTKAADQFDLLVRTINSGYINDYSLAIDGGAHLGVWAAQMATLFNKVLAFEPAGDTFALLTKNLEAAANVYCFQRALLDKGCAVEIVTPLKHQNTYSRYVQESKDGPVRAITIDSLALESCGFIKLDLEGAELRALRGAADTITRLRPVLMVEIKDHGQRFGNTISDTEEWLTWRNYAQIDAVFPDRVFVPIEHL